jgi:hypothetical protein
LKHHGVSIQPRLKYPLELIGIHNFGQLPIETFRDGLDVNLQPVTVDLFNLLAGKLGLYVCPENIVIIPVIGNSDYSGQNIPDGIPGEEPGIEIHISPQPLSIQDRMTRSLFG